MKTLIKLIIRKSIYCIQQKYCFFLFLLFPGSLLLAQVSTPQHCGFEVGTQMLLQLQEHRASLKYWENQYEQHTYARSNEQIIIPVFFHIAQTNSGRAATNLTTIEQALAQVNSAFETTNFQFILDDINFIQDQEFYSNGDNIQSSQLLVDNRQPNVLNVFVVKDISLGFPAYALFGEYVVIKEEFLIENFRKNMLAHEIGHFFGLFHTHGKFNNELENCLVDSSRYSIPNNISIDVFCSGAVRLDDMRDANNDGISDCEQTGDHVCDTRATGDLTNRVNANCAYIKRTSSGVLIDYYGDFYQPQVNNIMSYAVNFAEQVDCRTLFTEGQAARMYASLMEFNQEFLCSTGEIPAARILIVDNLSDDCEGSLRWAVNIANTRKGIDTILFKEALFSTAQKIILRKKLSIGADLVLIGNDSLCITGQATKFGLETGFITQLTIEGDNVRLERLTITDMSGSGLQINNSKQVSILNCNIQENSGSGIYLYNKCNSVQIADCKIGNNGIHGITISESEASIQNTLVQNNSNVGIAMFNANNTSIDSTYINNSGLGIYSFNSTDILIQEVSILQNVDHGIRMDSSNQISVLDCHIRENNISGIFIQNESKEIQIVDSKIENNFRGIQIVNSESSIKNTTVQNNDNIGIAMFNTVNTIIDSTYISDNDLGIYSLNSNNILIQEVSVLQNVDHGIRMDSSNQISILDCHIRENERSGIFIRNESKEIQIVDSKIENNNYRGIQINNSESTIKNTIVQNNDNIGIALFSTSKTIIDSTYISNNARGIYSFNSKNISIQEVSVLQNDFNGIRLDSSTQISIVDCSIFDNEEDGIMINNECKEVQIAHSEISDNQLNGILVSDSEASIQSSTIFCNELEQISTTSTRLAPTIQGLTRNGIAGTAIPNSAIYIYRNRDECTSCGASELLGNAIADAQGNWQFNSMELHDSLHYSLTTLATLNGNTSPLSACVVLGDLTTSIFDRPQTAPFLIKINANPTSQQFAVYIQTTKTNTPISLRLLNAVGQQVSTFEAPSNTWFTHNIGHLPSGVYILQANQDNSFQSVKIVKQ